MHGRIRYEMMPFKCQSVSMCVSRNHKYLDKCQHSCVTCSAFDSSPSVPFGSSFKVQSSFLCPHWSVFYIVPFASLHKIPALHQYMSTAGDFVTHLLLHCSCISTGRTQMTAAWHVSPIQDVELIWLHCCTAWLGDDSPVQLFIFASQSLPFFCIV